MNGIIEFPKKTDKKQPENNQKDIEIIADQVRARIMKCLSDPDCKCVYCLYTDNSVDMLLDFITNDMNNYEAKTGANFCTFDVKLVLYKAIKAMQNLEAELIKEHQ